MVQFTEIFNAFVELACGLAGRALHRWAKELCMISKTVVQVAFTLSATAVGLALVLAACSGTEVTPTPLPTATQPPFPTAIRTPMPTSTPTATPLPVQTPVLANTPAPTNTPTPSSNTVQAEIKSFILPNLTMKKGTTVTWTNKESAPHTSTGIGQRWESGSLGTNQSFSFTFNEVGAFGYFCQFHANMSGTVTVTGDSSGGGS